MDEIESKGGKNSTTDTKKKTEIDKINLELDKVELDKLNIDELIEETETLIKEKQEGEKASAPKEEPPPTIPTQALSEEPPKKKLRFDIVILIFVTFVMLIFLILSVLEYFKKPIIKTDFHKIDTSIFWITPSKKLVSEEQQKIKNYDFDFKFSYQFHSIKGRRILYTNLVTKFKSKATIPMDKLYQSISESIIDDFKKTFQNNFLEDIKNYQDIISEIIQNRAVDIIKQSASDIDINEVVKGINFKVFIVSE